MGPIAESTAIVRVSGPGLYQGITVTRICRNPTGMIFSIIKNTDAPLSIKLMRRCCTNDVLI